MTKFLIDTDIIIWYSRGEITSTEFLRSLKKVTISSVTVAEIIQGALNKNDLVKIEKSISSFEIIHITETISKVALELLEKYSLSYGLEFLDALIAATAIECKLTLATNNVKHFRMIRGLKLAKK